MFIVFQQTPVAGLFRPILSGDLGKSPSRHEAQAWSVSDPVDDRAKSKALVPYLHNIWPLLAIWDPNQRGYWEPCRTPSFLKRGWQIPCLSQTNAVLFSDGYCSWNQRKSKKHKETTSMVASNYTCVYRVSSVYMRVSGKYVPRTCWSGGPKAPH